MNIPFFIAKRIAFNKQKSFSGFIIKLSITATALSVAAMIITMAFVNGFQQTVSDKVFSFWGHIRVQHFEVNKPLVSEETPIIPNDTVINVLKRNAAVSHVQAFATKSAVLEKNKNIEGILLKGIDANYNNAALQKFLKKGRWLKFDDTLYNREIVVSEILSNNLGIQLNDTIKVLFVSTEEQTSTYRPVKVVGIYKTGIEEYDKLFAIGDIRLIRRINNWQQNEIGGYEVFLKDYHQMDKVSEELNLPLLWSSRTIQEVYPNIFDWLNIQDTNKNVMYVIMAIVAIINLITCLIILVLERVRMIGILKAIGAANTSIQSIFLYQATFITLAGIGLGFFFGVGLCLLQQFTGIIKLDEVNYYVATAPIKIIWWQVFGICLTTAFICFVSLTLPSLIIRKIMPVKAIQFR